jgi:hypothetical protein
MMDRIEADGVAAGLSSDEIFARHIDKILNANGMLSLDMRPCMHVSVTLEIFQQKTKNTFPRLCAHMPLFFQSLMLLSSRN